MVNREMPSSPEKYGQNVHAVLEFGRHEIPGKTPEGMSADWLTEQGKQNAATRGGEIKEANVAAYASPKERAQETVDLEMQAADIFSEGGVNVVNKRSSDLPEGLLKEGIQKKDNAFKVKVAEELDAVPNFAKIMPACQAWAEAEKQAGSKRGAYELIVQYYLDNTDLCEKEGVTTPHQAATEIAYRVAREVGMTEKFLNNTDIRLVNITHGPKLEPFLMAVVDDFETLEDMGDALKPGESFELEVDTDQAGVKTIKLKLRGKYYEVNNKALAELSDEYLKKVLPEREKRAEQLGQ
ncbi:MAG: hypothetical protein WCV71_01585 [Patescibacteria group bacterium]|jgi:hypothetical protein